MTKGKIKIGKLILRLENLDTYKPSRWQYEPWVSEDGSFQVRTVKNLIEVSFVTSVLKNRGNLLKELDGKTELVSADMFDTFEGVVSTQEMGVDGGNKRAVWKVTIVGDKSNVDKPA